MSFIVQHTEKAKEIKVKALAEANEAAKNFQTENTLQMNVKGVFSIILKGASAMLPFQPHSPVCQAMRTYFSYMLLPPAGQMD